VQRASAEGLRRRDHSQLGQAVLPLDRRCVVECPRLDVVGVRGEKSEAPAPTWRADWLFASPERRGGAAPSRSASLGDAPGPAFGERLRGRNGPAAGPAGL